MSGNESKALESFIAELQRDERFKANVSVWKVLESSKGSYSDFPADLPASLKQALKSRGINRLYSHQRACYELAQQNKSFVVVTPTASGKTLCYNLSVLKSLLAHNSHKALYLFPTKALSQDQQAELNEISLSAQLGIKIHTYDGDTPNSVRMSARNTGQIIITNPDMLHSGILPNHPKWIKFFQSLKYLVLDEIHTYRGIFGSHMANLMRRLKRIAAFYGSNPLFICCSATIGNPRDLAEKLLEMPMELVDSNGAPRGERHFILYNPPLLDRVQGIRRGVVLESQELAVRLLEKRIKTIVFARSRIRTELIAAYIKSKLANLYSDNKGIKVASYRGGYLPSERRAIEKGLRDDTIHGVVSTNALELGIDIGGLDASIMAGFPGSIASAWQQAGRAGRNSRLSLSILMASASPLNQYIIRHPDYFFAASPESGWIDPDNIYVLMDQLKCALFELPFAKGELFPGDVSALLEFLQEQGTIRLTGEKWYWADRSYPAENVSLRTSTTENIVIIDTTAGKNTVIGEMDRPSAKELIFDNAVYLHSGAQYMVSKLDLANKKCFVTESQSNYFTDAIVKSDIKVLHLDKEIEVPGFKISLGDVRVRTSAGKFKKIKYHTHENIGYGDIHLPEEEMHTKSAVLILASELASGRALKNLDNKQKQLVLNRFATCLKQVAPLFLLCDARDLGIAERMRDPHFDEACIYVYDKYPGGSGLAEGLVCNLAQVISGCREVVQTCPCTAGCPSCIGPPEDAADINPKQLLMSWLIKIYG